MTKSNLAKWLARLGGVVGTIALSGVFGKYKDLGVGVSTLLLAASAHLASDTSAGHPNG